MLNSTPRTSATGALPPVALSPSARPLQEGAGGGLELKDLVAPPAARVGVRAHASDPLSRLLRRRRWVPV